MSRLTPLFIPLLFSAALLAQPAQAGVTYVWQQVEASSSMPANLNLELVFSSKAVAQGRLDLEILNDCLIGTCEFQQDSLLSLRYWYAAPELRSSTHNLIEYHYSKAPAVFFDHIHLDLTFLPNGMLSGSIFANNGESNFLMSSAGSLFTMIRASSDQGDGCGFAYPECAGATGLLVAVPEPSSAALAGLGLLAAWSVRRRKGPARA